MSRNLEKLKEKLRGASERLKKSLLLPPGDYRFAVVSAEIKHDDQRAYDYLYVKVLCDGETASDRFPFADNMLFKLAELLKAVGLEIDDWADPKDLVGRSGKLTAEAHDDGKVFYKYLKP
jgi:hypothetical protein